MKNNQAVQSFNTIRLLLLLVFIILAVALNAQTDITITAQGDAERKVPFTERLILLPKVVDTSFNAYPVSYQLIPVKVELNLQPQTIQPVQLTVLEPLQKLYKGYVKGGVGNFLTTYGDLYYSSTRSKQDAWSINMKHHSSQGGLKDLGFNGYSDNKIGVAYQYFKMRYSVEAKANYERNALYYYGANPANFSGANDSLNLSKDGTFQRFNIFGGNVKYQTHIIDSSKLNRNFEVAYRFMDDYKGVGEHYVKLSGEEMKFIEKEVYYLNYSLDYNYFKHPLFTSAEDRITNGFAERDNGILNLNPNIRTHGDNWSVRVGLAIQSNVTTSTAKFHFYPDAEADYRLFNDIFVPYVGIKGGLQRNSFFTFTRENPFVTSDLDLRNTNKVLDFYGGIRGSISSKVSFNVVAEVAKYRDFVLFVNDTENFYGNAFNVIYDTVTQTTFSAQTSYVNNEKLKIYLRGEYYLYSTVHQPKAWNRPNYTVSLSGVYDLADKILVRGDLFLVGDRYHYYNTAIFVNYPEDFNLLKPFLDFNLGFEYRYTKRLSAFLNFNNILAKKYQYWNNFPVQGINLLGGVTYRF